MALGKEGKDEGGCMCIGNKISNDGGLVQDPNPERVLVSARPVRNGTYPLVLKSLPKTKRVTLYTDMVWKRSFRVQV